MNDIEDKRKQILIDSRNDSISNSKSTPIFILGTMQRSGTNFLWQLLLRHPDCHPGSVGEDFLLKNAPLLKQYSKKLFKNWTPEWRERYKNSPDFVLSKIGCCLISLIEKPYYLHNTKVSENFDCNERFDGNNGIGFPHPRLVTKTPSVKNLNLFFRLFPHAHLIIIIRDGRAVVESGRKSFGWRFEDAIRKWNKAAIEILQFDRERSNHPNKRYMIVKFEDLFRDSKKEIKKILDFLGLDSDRYDFELADSLPVYGSSEIQTTEESLHWKPIKKNESFDPTKRWANWDKNMHSRFNWIAGETMVRLNYSINSLKKVLFFSYAFNLLLDGIYWLKQAIERIKDSISGMINK